LICESFLLITHRRTYIFVVSSCADVITFFFAYCLTTLRAELSLLKQHIESQTKELDHRMHRVEELEEKERVANENVSLIMFAISLI
jgi:cell division protein FtsL